MTAARDRQIPLLPAGTGAAQRAPVLYGLGALIVVALSLVLVLAAWLVTLIAGAVLLLIAAILALLGRRQLQRATPPVPASAADSIRADVKEIKERARR